MKIYILGILCLLGFPYLAVSQSFDFKIIETSRKINDGNDHNVLIVSIYETTEDVIKREWKSQVKDLGGKTTTNQNLINATGASIKEFGNLPFNLYSMIEKVDGGYYQLIVGIDLGGAYMSSKMHPDKFKIFNLMMVDFAKKLTKESIESQVKAATKELEKRQGDQDDLVKENEKLHSSINKWQEQIKKAETDLENNLKNQEEQKKKIEDAKSLIEIIKGKMKDL